MRKTTKDMSRMTISLNCKEANLERWGTNRFKINKDCQRLCIRLTASQRSGGKNVAYCFTREELLINEMEEAGTFIVLHLHPPLCPRLVGNQIWDSFFNREPGKKPWNSLGAVKRVSKRWGKAARAAGGSSWGDRSHAGRKGEGSIFAHWLFLKRWSGYYGQSWASEFHFSKRCYHKQLSKRVNIKR